MYSDEEDDIIRSERLPIYQKGKEIFDMVNKITALIPENDEYLNEVKACMLSDAALLTVKVAGAEAARGIGPFDKDPDNDIPFRGFKEDPEE